jgi:hypothetical protein
VAERSKRETDENKTDKKTNRNWKERKDVKEPKKEKINSLHYKRMTKKHKRNKN